MSNNVVDILPVDMWGQILEYFSNETLRWFDIMLVCKAFRIIGRRIFNPAIKKGALIREAFQRKVSLKAFESLASDPRIEWKDYMVDFFLYEAQYTQQFEIINLLQSKIPQFKEELGFVASLYDRLDRDSIFYIKQYKTTESGKYSNALCKVSVLAAARGDVDLLERLYGSEEKMNRVIPHLEDNFNPNYRDYFQGWSRPSIVLWHGAFNAAKSDKFNTFTWCFDHIISQLHNNKPALSPMILVCRDSAYANYIYQKVDEYKKSHPCS